jgi:2-alkenal reductase
MNVSVKSKVSALLLAAAFTASACGVAASPAATVDTGALADQVLAQVESRLAQDQAQVVPVSALSQAEVANSLEVSLTSVYAQANPSVVTILTSTGSGSGFIYSAGGYIVTNNHVIAGARTISVEFSDGSSATAQVVGASAANDLAVLKAARLPQGAAPLTLAANSVEVGQFVVAIGSPFGEQGSMSFGIVSGLNRTLESQVTRRGVSTGPNLADLIQTDAPINPGNSGGPLLNLDGQVIGINTAIESTSGSGSGVGFAIPASVVQQVVPGLIGSTS